MNAISLAPLILVLLLSTPSSIQAVEKGESADGGSYKEHDPVVVLGSRVGPFDNPHETYRYDYMPFCREAGEDARMGSRTRLTRWTRRSWSGSRMRLVRGPAQSVEGHRWITKY